MEKCKDKGSLEGLSQFANHLIQRRNQAAQILNITLLIIVLILFVKVVKKFCNAEEERQKDPEVNPVESPAKFQKKIEIPEGSPKFANFKMIFRKSLQFLQNSGKYFQSLHNFVKFR